VERARELHRFDRRQPKLRLVAQAGPVLSAAEAAARISARVAEAVGPARFERYFAEQARVEVDGPVVRVVAASPTLAALLDRRFGKALRDAASAEAAAGSEPRRLEFVVDGGGFAPSVSPPQPSSGVGRIPAAADPPPRVHVRPTAPAARAGRFEDFVVGESNQLAFNAAASLAESTADDLQRGLASSMLFIHGPCGVGKTHLLQALAARYREAHPGAVVRVTTGESFMNEFVQSIKQTTGGGPGAKASTSGGGAAAGVERFRRQYRRCDLLCIDDVHFLASKQATQQELLHTFDEIALSGARIALVCDRHPRQIRQFSPALVSRFMAGMVASIDAPDASVRERAVRLFAQRRGLVLEQAAVRLLVERTRTAPGAAVIGLRDIEGILTRVEAIHRLLSGAPSSGGAVGVLVIERALGEQGSAGGVAASVGTRGVIRRPIRVESISSQTCTELGVDPADLGAPTRHKRVVLARAVITHLARQFTTMSYPEIARAIGRPSHSTVITAHQRLQKQVEADESYGIGPEGEAMTIRALLDRLSSSLARS